MLKYSREDSADILKDFECGIRAMDDFMMHSGNMYPTLEIDYLAVRRDLRDKGIGTEIKVTPQSHSTKNKDSLLCKSIPRSMIPSGWQNASKQVKALV